MHTSLNRDIRHLIDLNWISARTNLIDEHGIGLAGAYDAAAVQAAAQERSDQAQVMIAESSKLVEIGLDVQTNCNPSQTIIAGPFLEVGNAGRGLRQVICCEIGALLLGQHDPANDRDPLPVEKAHDIGPLRGEVESGNGNGGMQLSEKSDEAGTGKQALHLFHTVFATSKLEMRWNSRTLDTNPRRTFLGNCVPPGLDRDKEKADAERSEKAAASLRGALHGVALSLHCA